MMVISACTGQQIRAGGLALGFTHSSCLIQAFSYISHSGIQWIGQNQLSNQYYNYGSSGMNIWLKTETMKQAKLKDSLVDSSVASRRSPLPIILQTDRHDDVRSNSNISVDLSSKGDINFAQGRGKQRNRSDLARNNPVKSTQLNNIRCQLSKSTSRPPFLGSSAKAINQQGNTNLTRFGDNFNRSSVRTGRSSSLSSESSSENRREPGWSRGLSRYHPSKSKGGKSFNSKQASKHKAMCKVLIPDHQDASKMAKGTSRGSSDEDSSKEYDSFKEKAHQPSKQKHQPIHQASGCLPQQKSYVIMDSVSKQLYRLNEQSSKWENSLNSLASIHIRNSSQKLLYSSYQKSEHANVLQNTNRRTENSKKNNSYGHTNSKRMLTTGRQNDRREYIISIIEYCSNEVGLACYNINTGEIKLTQIIERMTYIKTISTLQRFYPQEIIFSATLEYTLLMQKLMNIFRRTAFKPVKRSLFDETKGYYIYTLRGNKNEHNPDYKFLSYAALHALLATLENTFELTLTYSALNIKWHYLEEVLVIDSQTIADLQIFINKETKIIKNTFIDNFKCLTDGGMRMLRANILQPLTDEVLINDRFHLVQMLVRPENRGVLDMLAKELCKFKNYEPITAKFIQNPKCDNIRSVKSYLNGILMLSRMCFELQNLQKKVGSIMESGALGEFNSTSQGQGHQKRSTRNSIMENLSIRLKDQKLRQIRKVIQQNFQPEILKNYENAGLQDRQFDLKPINRKKKGDTQALRSTDKRRDNFIFLFKLEKINDEFAEISRLTYSHTIEDILKIFQQIKQKCPPENCLRLLYNQYRGYFISGKSTQTRPVDLGEISHVIEDDIIYINTRGNTVTFSTSMLISLNNRLKENEHKLIYQSTELLLNIIKQIQRNMDILFEINYWISMLDMILAFVMFVKLYQNSHNITFSRPVFLHPEGTAHLKIEKLRTVWTMEKLQRLSNHVSLSLDQGVSSLVILKELNSFDQINILYSIGYLTILSQIGCLVPAQSYRTFIYETLISKMEVEGNLENKMSHFQTELFSLRNILENAQDRDAISEKDKKSYKKKCLILIDEICKGTKPEEQYALSMAAVEQLTRERDQAAKNISVILVSDWTLFDRLSKFKRVTSCEFSKVEQEESEDNIPVKKKEEELLNCFKKYNFSLKFQTLYLKLPRVLQP